jgi:drug/metabolite transporter (DMT)-like permease
VLNIGDLYTLFCTFFYALQIIMISRYTHMSDPMLLATVEITVVALLSTLFSFVLEKPVIPTQPSVWLAVLVTSLLATTFAFIVQNIAQKHTSPTHTALIFLGEPVFAQAFAYFMLGELLTPRQLVGCALILAGMVAAEFKPSLKRCHRFRKSPLTGKPFLWLPVCCTAAGALCTPCLRPGCRAAPALPIPRPFPRRLPTSRV